MAVPGASQRFIKDLVPDVIEALQQRTDVESIVPRYIRKAIIELTESTPFEELRRTGPLVSLTTNQAIYPVSFFLNSGDDYNYPEAFVLYINPPANTVEYTLRYKTPNAIESIMSPSTTGIPAFWSRYGTNFHLAPVPNAGYSTFLRYQVKHPFPDDLSALGSQQLYLPDSWEEIVVYSAAERIAIVKRWNEQAMFLHNILFGDPEYQTSEGKRGRPGLISARILQVERDQRFNSRNLGIVQPRYNTR